MRQTGPESGTGDGPGSDEGARARASGGDGDGGGGGDGGDGGRRGGVVMAMVAGSLPRHSNATTLRTYSTRIS